MKSTRTLKEYSTQGNEIYADLPTFRINGGTIPADIVVTGERPDLIIVNRNLKKIYLVELTCSFETNVDSANVKKKMRYLDLKKIS